MGFVKTVAGKSLHLFVNMRSDFFGNVILFTALYELFTELFHYVQFLFTHSLTQSVSLAGGKAAQCFGNLHNLLLIHHTAVGLFQGFFQHRRFIDDFFLSVFAAHEHIHHTRFHRPGAVERHQGGHVAKLGRLQLFNQVAHTAAFQLENAQRFARAKHIVGFFIIQRDFINIKIGVVAGANHFFGIINDR